MTMQQPTTRDPGGNAQTMPPPRENDVRQVNRPPEVIQPRQRETKPGIASTELYLTLAAVAGLLIATYVASDSLTRSDGWKYTAWVVIAYVISRGLAKLGSSNRMFERDRLDNR